MTIAIGGWVLFVCATSPLGVPTLCRTVSETVRNGEVVRGFDTAEDCERDRARKGGGEAAGLRCVPALALVNR